MDPERWQQIDKLLDELLECRPEQRDAFLEQACGTDLELRKEVELLLDHDESAKGFIEEPAFADAAAFLANSQFGIEPQKTIGLYTILGPLGAGGMGDVYVAVDQRLGRKVALKLLRSEVTCNADQVRRFRQEARAASALNHPNILTIYEIGEAGSVHFIATELVEGETIRHRMQRSRMSLPEALDVSIQIAGALAAAHKGGIVHRDIKPENIMIREDGYAKLLDFGLAKLTERPALPDPDAGTIPLVNTDTGVVIGTPGYMSPEQLRGLAVDPRTDIFSLGVTMYEMVTGRPPFDAPTVGDLVVAILQKEPAPIAPLAPAAAGELERIINKAIRKSRDERYQTMEELAEDLKRLKREMDLKASAIPPASGGGTCNASGAIPNNVNKTTVVDDVVRPTLVGGNQTTAERETAQTPSASKPVQTGLTASSSRVKPTYIKAGLVLLAILALVAVLIYFSGGGSTPINALAILPFQNEIADPNMEYLSDGIPESIIDSLSPVSDLKVMSFGSVLAYKNHQPDVKQVARDLKVQVVLTGIINQHGNVLQVNAELVDARDNSVLWGGHYNRSLDETVTIQEDIAKEISDKLRLRLTSDEQKQLVKRYTENTEAYQLYLQGRYYWSKRNRDAIQQAVKYFRMAIDKDPNYALAWAGLADSYATPSAELQPNDAMPKAREAANRALAIDDNLAEAHASLAFVEYRYDWNWKGAEAEFTRSIDLNPNYAVAHQWYGECLTYLGRYVEAQGELDRAAELDPLSLSIKVDTATLFYYNREYDKAIEQCHKALEMDSGFRLAHIMLGRVYEQKHMDKEAVDEALKARTLHGDSPETLAGLKAAFEARGLTGYFEKAAEIGQAEAKKGPVGQFSLAGLYASLGRNDEAFAALDIAFQQKEPTLVTLKVDPRLYSLHSDPRFPDQLRRINLTL